jgi:hypothetical protein
MESHFYINKETKKPLWIVIIMTEIIAGVIFVFIGGAYLSKTKDQEPSKSLAVYDPETVTPTKYAIATEYKIIAINESEITISTEKGTMILPKNDQVEVFRGVPGHSIPVTFEDLKIGQKVNLEVIPEAKAWVYIL